MEIVVIIQKLGKHGDRTPVVFLDLAEGQKHWEEIKTEFNHDEDAQRYYDCELWRGEATSLRLVAYLKGHYT